MDEMGDSLILEKGVREKKVKAKKERVSNYYHVEPIPSKARHQNIKVAFEYRKYHSDKKDEALKYGKAVHELFSKIDTQADVKNALEISFNEGIFSATELTILQEKIQRILNIEKVKDWFSGKGEKFLERELVNAHGKILRPDRIMIIDDQVSVIDYKTGLMNEKNLKKYTKQVKEYMEALGAMGYTMVEGYIISMDEEYLISI